MAEETLTAKQIGAAKSRAKMAAKKAEAAEAKPEIIEVKEDIHEITEEDIVKSQVKAKEEARAAEVKAAEVKPVEVKVEAIAPAIINVKPIIVELPGGKCVAKVGNKELIRGSREKVEHYIAQF